MSPSHIQQLVLAGALAIDLFIGEYPEKTHPVLWMGSYIRFLWERRISDSHKTLFLWGIFLLLSGGLLFGLIPLIFLTRMKGFFYVIAASFLLKPAFAFKALAKAARQVETALEENDLDKARTLTSYHLVSRDTSQLTSEEVTGAVIESVAENITDGFISPLFYFLIGGVPAAWFYRFVNTCDSMIGYRKEDYEWGGKFAARLDDILNWVPARLSALILIAASALQGANWLNAWKTMVQEKEATTSPNAGWTMSAMAGALEIRLEKKGEYSLDGGEKTLDFHLIGFAIRIVVTAMILFTVLAIACLEVVL